MLKRDPACVLHARGRVSCWGLNDRGQLGLEHGDSRKPVTVRYWPDGGGYLPLEDGSEMASVNGTTCVVTLPDELRTLAVLVAAVRKSRHMRSLVPHALYEQVKLAAKL